MSICMFAGVSALCMLFRKSDHSRYCCRFPALARCRCLLPRYAAQVQFAEGDDRPAASRNKTQGTSFAAGCCRASTVGQVSCPCHALPFQFHPMPSSSSSRSVRVHHLQLVPKLTSEEVVQHCRRTYSCLHPASDAPRQQPRTHRSVRPAAVRNTWKPLQLFPRIKLCPGMQHKLLAGSCKHSSDAQ